MPPHLTPRHALFLTLLIMLFVLGRNLGADLPALMAADMPNPDSYQKLLMVRDHDPAMGFNFMARDNAPYGFWMHWSLPHTGLLWLASNGLMQLGMAQNQALLLAGGGLTLLSMMLLILLVLRVSLNIASPRAAIIGVMAIASSPPLHGYGQLLQITHHIFMLLPVALAALCFLRNTDRAMPMADAVGGMALAAALWISPETMPLVVCVAGMRAAWRLQHPQSGALWPAVLGLMGLLIMAWHLDPPAPTYSAWALDHISLAWLLMGTLLALLWLHADGCVRRQLSLGRAIAELSLGVMLAAACWLMLVPDAMRGPDGLITPYLHSVWYRHINELQPVGSFSKAVGYLLLPLTGGCLLLWTAWRERSLWMLTLALSTLVYVVLISSHVRMGSAGALLGVLSFAIGVSRLHDFENMHDKTLPMRRQLLVAGLIMVLPLQVAAPLLEGYWNAKNTKPDAAKTSCDLKTVLPLLNTLPAGTLLADTNHGPRLMLMTPHRVIAGNYHHNLSGLTDSYRMQRDLPPDNVATSLAMQRRLDYVLACSPPDQTQPRSQQLMARIARGESITWLNKKASHEGWHLYERPSEP